jgi:predicted nucleic acid-binding protein
VVGTVRWVSSEVALLEGGWTTIRSVVSESLRHGTTAEIIAVTTSLISNGPGARDFGIPGSSDALHLATAEAAGCDVFLTTDDRLLHDWQDDRREETQVTVNNPVSWLQTGTFQ